MYENPTSLAVVRTVHFKIDGPYRTYVQVEKFTITGLTKYGIENEDSGLKRMSHGQT